MTIYTLSVITSTGYPYFNTEIKKLPEGIRLYLRFFDFTQNLRTGIEMDKSSSFELTSGLVSALFEFAKSLDKKIRTLEFRSKSLEDEVNTPKEVDRYTGDVLITSQTETYLFHKSFKQKIDLIYNMILAPKIPLESSNIITDSEERKIIDILTDATAREHVLKNKNEAKVLAESFLRAMGEYGLESIVVTSFDLTPITNYGGKHSLEDIEEILRNIGEIPEIDALEWKYRQSFLKGEQVWVYLCNSGIGVTVEDQLFEPYFYLLIADPQSYLADFPTRVISEFNLILG